MISATAAPASPSEIGAAAGSRTRSLEHWTGATPLCYAILGVGAVLLAFCLGAIADGSSPRVGKARKGEDPEIEVKLDKNQARKILKEAQALRKRGELVEAAELLWSHEQLDTAAAYFIEAGEFSRAAEIRHDQNRFEESAELHLQGENYETAGLDLRAAGAMGQGGRLLPEVGPQERRRGDVREGRASSAKPRAAIARASSCAMPPRCT